MTQEEQVVLRMYELYQKRLIEAFLKKHGMFDDDGIFLFEPIDIEHGYSVFECCEYIIYFDDVLYDMKARVPASMFFKWMNYDMAMMSDGYSHISYCSYILGYRHPERGRFERAIRALKNMVSLKLLTIKTIFK